MGQTELAVNFFVALFALLDPVGNVPIFAAATHGANPQARRMIAVYIAMFSFAFLLFFYFTGLALLEFFGISIAAFRIAGGVLLFLLGLEMAREDFTAAFTDPAAAAAAGRCPSCATPSGCCWTTTRCSSPRSASWWRGARTRCRTCTRCRRRCARRA